jgi:serine acetyltransferase
VIGEGSVIGSNTWITKSVPPGTHVSYSTGADGGDRQIHTSPPPPDNA